MSKRSFKGAIRGMRMAAQKHSPAILTGIGIAGMITGTVLAVKATPKALILIEEQKEEMEATELPRKEILKTVWKCYIPAAAVETMSVACLICASSTNARRNAAIATAYALSESTLKEYQEKVIETIGEKKEKSVREAIMQDKVDRDPVRDVIITQKSGNTICYDVMSARYFKSDMDKIEKAVNDLNRRMRDECYILLNDFYYELGLDDTKAGSLLGWNIDNGYIDISYSSHLDANGTPCLVMDYNVVPMYDYK